MRSGVEPKPETKTRGIFVPGSAGVGIFVRAAQETVAVL
jgi:hypothetical protein